MAIRYSGTLTIKIKLLDGNEYACRIIGHNGPVAHVVNVGSPRWIDESLDSPGAYDSAARAALAFAHHDGIDIESGAEYDDSGYVVTRKRPSWVRS